MEAPPAESREDGHGSDPHCFLYPEQGLPAFRGLHLRICSGALNLLLVREGRS
jgi:hypothetical protein